jgi:hypothetical protein
LAAPFSLVGVPESCDLQLPVHSRSQLRARICRSGSFRLLVH